MRIERKVDGAGMVVAIENALPVLAAIARAVNAAVLVRAVRMAERSYIHEVRIRGIDANARDGLRILQPNVLPGFAGIAGAIDAIALYGGCAQLGFTRADVNDVRI